MEGWKKKIFSWITGLAGVCFLSGFLSGCGKVVNPYHGEFTCPQAERGKCVGVGTAYEEVIRAEEELMRRAKLRETSEDLKKRELMGNQTFSLFDSQYEENLYLEGMILREQMFGKLHGILRDPQTPLLVTPQVVRVLILPYSQGKNLYMGRYVYVMLDEPRWILENIIFEGWEKE